MPEPLHSEHVLEDVPGAAPDPPQAAHSSVMGTLILIRPPRMLVSNATSTTYSTLRPLLGPARPRLGSFFPRSKMVLKRSEMPPPKPERSSKEKLSPGLLLPYPGPGLLREKGPFPPPGPNPKAPNRFIWLYCLRFSSSERTE